MNVSDLIDPSFSYRLITSLLHFLWQGCLVALLAILGDWFLSSVSASRRYVLHVAALAIMVACVVVTFSRIESPIAVSPESFILAADVDSMVPDRESFDPSAVQSTVIPQLAEIEPSFPKSPPSIASVDTIQAPTVPQASTTDDRWRTVQRWAPQITLLYFLGCGLLFARLIRGTWVAHRLRGMATIVSDDALIASLQRQSKALGLRVVPRIAWCAEVSIPLVVGVLKPMILLPMAAATGLSPDQLQALIMHELAHIRRYDLLVNWVQRLVESMLFFHPAVWFISRRISNEREEACDELVLATGYERLQYADALVRMAELSSSLRNLGTSAPATSLAASGGNSSEFKRRVLKVLSVPTPSHLRPSRISLLMAVTLIFAVTISMSGLRLNVLADTQSDNGETATTEFLKSYPQLNGVSLDMSEARFKAIARSGRLAVQATPNDRGKSRYAIPMSDDHTIVVMFENGMCSGIHRIRGEEGPKQVTFDRLTVAFKNSFGTRQAEQIDIQANGDCVYHIEELPAQGTNPKRTEARLTLTIDSQRMLELERLLDETGWLTRDPPEPPAPPLHSDETPLTVIRNGVATTKQCFSPRDESYRTLLWLLRGIAKQESFVYTIDWLGGNATDRNMALLEIRSGIEALEERPGHALPYFDFDYQRLLPTFSRMLRNPSEVADEVLTAIKVATFVRSDAEFEFIARLKHDRNSRLRGAVATAIADFGGERAIPLLVEMVPSTEEARWGLVRLGDISVPALVKLIEPGSTASDIVSEQVVRVYLDHQKELPDSIDDRIISAVGQALAKTAERDSQRTEYFKEFLQRFEQRQPNANHAQPEEPQALNGLLPYYGGFSPFRLKPFSKAGDSTVPVQPLDPLVSHLPKEVQAEANRRFDDALQAIAKISPDQFESASDRIILESRDLPAVYRAALMFNLWVFSNDWETNDSFRQAFGFDSTMFGRTKNKCIMVALEQAAEIPDGLTIRMLELSTYSLSSLDTDNDPNWPAMRRMKAKLWLTLIEKIRLVIDPNWDPNDYPLLEPNGPPNGDELQAVVDPQQRAALIAQAEDRRLQAVRYNQQREIHRLVTELSPRMEEDLVRLYVRRPFHPNELELLLDEHAADKAQCSRVAKSVRLVNAILPNGTRLKYGWPDALAEAGPTGVPALIEAVNDTAYPNYIRDDGAWALGLIGDPRAINTLTAVAEDDATPAKYKDIAREFVRSLKEKISEPKSEITNDLSSDSALPAAMLKALDTSPMFECRALIKQLDEEGKVHLASVARERLAQRWKVITEQPVVSFLRELPKQDSNSEPNFGEQVGVQTDLDGVWSNGLGTADNWTDWIIRKQNDYRIGRLHMLFEAAQGYRKTEDAASEKRVLQAGLTGHEIYDVDLKTLLGKYWPITNDEPEKSLGSGPVAWTLANYLEELSAAQQTLGEIDAAIETHSRLTLTHFMLSWNQPSSGPTKHARKLWSLIRKQSKPTQPLFWFNMMDEKQPKHSFDLSSAGKRAQPLTYHHENVAASIPLEFAELTITAQTQGQKGFLDCYRINAAGLRESIGLLKPSADGNAQQTLTGTLKVPVGTSLVQFMVAGDDFQAGEVTVEATFFKPEVGVETATQQHDRQDCSNL